MRYAYLLAVLTGIALVTESTYAQQGALVPAYFNAGSVQNGVVDPVSDDLAMPQTLDKANVINDTSDDCGCASCDTCCSGCSRWSVTMQYLDWRASRDVTPYAGTLDRPSGTIQGLPIDTGSSFYSTLFETNYSRSGGLRLDIAYAVHDNWDIGFRYTNFDTSGNSAFGDPTQDTNAYLANRLDRSLANVILDTSFDDGETDFASQHIGINANVYDIEIRRHFRFHSPRVSARMLGGFRFAQIDQDSEIRYQNLESGNLLTADTSEALGMSAAGLYFGGETRCYVGWNTSLFARGAASLLYADFDTSRLDVQTGNTEAGIRSISDSSQKAIPVLELDVGARWQYGRFHVACGYDISTWFNMIQALDAINQDDVDGATNSYRIERGDLTFDGFFAEVGVRF